MFNHTAAIAAAGCDLEGNPPPDVMQYCRPGPGPGPAPLPKHPHGDFSVLYAFANGTARTDESSLQWRSLRSGPLHGGPAAPWAKESWPLPQGELRVRFACAGATPDRSNYCALDTVSVVAA